MNFRKLGRTGLEVSEIGFGAWAIGGAMWGGADDATSTRALDHAIELGCNLIDTALVYGDGRSERVVGEVARRHASKSGRGLVVATKVPPLDQHWPARHDTPLANVFPKAQVIGACEKSLKNLGLDAIDLLQLHVWAPAWAQQDEWHAGLDELKQSGKVRFVGISLNDHEPETGIAVVESGQIDAVQVIYNVFDQSPGDGLLAACGRHGVGVLARVPLDEGSLTGKLTLETRFGEGDFRNHYFRGKKLEQAVAHVEALRPVLEGLGGPMAEGALRFCLSAPEVTCVIPGMRTAEQVDKNLRASERGPLPPAAIEALKSHRWERNFYVGLH
jgi:aryl-alcohol dehydrogenase-like predicted oxidoreductase